MHADLARFWDHDRLPPPGRFDPRDEAQFNVVALHLLELYWSRHQVEVFAAFCSLCRDALRHEAACLFDTAPDRRPDAHLDAPSREADRRLTRPRSSTLDALVDALLAELFMVSGRTAPRVLHLRAYARSRLAALARAGSRRHPLGAGSDSGITPAAYLAGVE